MPKFPIKETDVIVLADQMVAGYTAHAADFPSVTIADLTAALTAYRTQKQAQDDADSQAKIATITKDTKLDDLVELMKNDLKLSEVDVTAAPEKLFNIGWGPRQQPTPIEAPGSPSELHPVFESQGVIGLVWNRPLSGGTVRNYIIERHQQLPDGQYSPWVVAGSSFNCEINLIDQPENVRVEYRVRAVNTSGESMPSNTVSVVLP